MGAGDLTDSSWDGYAARWESLHGVDPRGVATPVRGWIRLSLTLARPLARFGVGPGAVTATALFAALLVPGFAGRGGGWPVAAGIGVLVGVVAESVSRALAVLMDRITRLGDVNAALVSRLGELCWLFALWLLGAAGVLVVACWAVSWFHEYVRSRALLVGMEAVDGAGGLGTGALGERGMRALVAGVGLTVCGFSGALSQTLAAGTATLAAVTWLLLSSLGLFQLLSSVRRALK